MAGSKRDSRRPTTKGKAAKKAGTRKKAPSRAKPAPGKGAGKAPGKAAGSATGKAARKGAGKGATKAASLAPRTLDVAHMVERLESHAEVFRNLVQTVGPQQARWQPSRGAWSVLEVVCHLRDEEREDFRARIERTLFAPGEPWSPIDPQGWVTERRYREQDLATVLRTFLEERAQSVGWLRGLGDVDWQHGYEHPKLGTLRTGDLLVSWVAHDCLHLRQLARLHYLYANERAAAFSSRYAGDW